MAPPGGGYNPDTEPRSQEESDLLQKARQFSQVLDRAPVEVKPQRQHGGFIWQVHNKYILSQINNGIAIIDQHVAHERILYEEALRDMDENKGTSQSLLFLQPRNFRQMIIMFWLTLFLRLTPWAFVYGSLDHKLYWLKPFQPVCAGGVKAPS